MDRRPRAADACPAGAVRLTSTSRSARSQIESARARTSARVSGSMKAPPPSARTWRSLVSRRAITCRSLMRNDGSPISAKMLAMVVPAAASIAASASWNGQLQDLARRRPTAVLPAPIMPTRTIVRSIGRRCGAGSEGCHRRATSRRSVPRTFDRALKVPHALRYKAAIRARGKPFAAPQLGYVAGNHVDHQPLLLVLLLVMVARRHRVPRDLGNSAADGPGRARAARRPVSPLTRVVRSSLPARSARPGSATAAV